MLIMVEVFKKNSAPLVLKVNGEQKSMRLRHIINKSSYPQIPQIL